MVSQVLPGHWRVTENPSSPFTLILAPGSGSLMDTVFMETLAEALAGTVRVVRFEFPFQQWMREQGRPRPPAPLSSLLAFYQEQVRLVQAQWPDTRLWVGGKSLGGRVAVHLLADASSPLRDLLEGAVVFGYPFHPVAKPGRLRTAVLEQTTTPLWIAQGERDALGSREEVAGYGLPLAIDLHWVRDGNHDLRARRQPENAWRAQLNAVAGAAAAFIEQHAGRA